MPIEKFAINVSDAVLADLSRRLDATRWPDEIENAGWEGGTNLAYMKALTAYWRNGYDWRRQEATLNDLPHYRMALDGLRVHFVHRRGKGPRPLPLIHHAWLAGKLRRNGETHPAPGRSCGAWRERGRRFRRGRPLAAGLRLL